MNNINENYTILTDVELDDLLCEYFNVNDIIFDFISLEKKDIPLIDQILSKTNNKKILLIVGIDSLIRLCDETSKYNNFLDLINSDKIKLIYYRFGDSFLEMNNRSPFCHTTKYFNYENHGGIRRINNILKDLKFTWWNEFAAGNYAKNYFKNVEFYNLVNCNFSFFRSNHYFFLKKDKEKTKTFFSLIRLHKRENRIHRNILIEKIQNENYIKNSIVTFNSPDKGKNIFSDLETEYGKIYLSNLGSGFDSVPVPSYYEKTYFEVVCETYGAIDGDDTFLPTEKTLKPIAMGHPFIVLSTKHFLRNLRELGFKTFGDFIDESYDECDRIEDKVEIISKILERLDMDASKKFYEDSIAIREHNQNHLMYLQGRNKFDLWSKWNTFFKNFE